MRKKLKAKPSAKPLPPEEPVSPLGALHDEAAVPEPGPAGDASGASASDSGAASAPPAIDTQDYVPPVTGSGLRRKTVLEKLLGITCGLRLVCFDESADDDDPEWRHPPGGTRPPSASGTTPLPVASAVPVAQPQMTLGAAPRAGGAAPPAPKGAAAPPPAAGGLVPGAVPVAGSAGPSEAKPAPVGGGAAPSPDAGAADEVAPAAKPPGSPNKMPQFAKAPVWEQIDMSAARPSRKWQGLPKSMSEKAPSRSAAAPGAAPAAEDTKQRAASFEQW